MITTNWDSGVSCRDCGAVIELGDEMLYGRCLACGRAAALQRNAAPAAPEQTLAMARDLLSRPGRIVLTRRQLRSLLSLLSASVPDFEPVRRPDRGSGKRWYGRLSGWDPARVERGLSVQETAGLFADYLDVGRIPPVRHEQLARIVTAIESASAMAGDGNVIEQDNASALA